MLAKTAEDVQGKVVEGLFGLLFTPAAFFWLAGTVVWLYACDGRYVTLELAAENLSTAKTLFFGVGALAVVVLSGAANEMIATWFLQRLLGYWWPFDALGAPSRAFLAWRRRCASKPPEKPRRGVAGLQNDAATEATLRYVPPSDTLPTSFGCALAAADQRILKNYGLSSSYVWPALQLVLSDAARTAVTAARTDIEASGRLVFWALASLGWLALAGSATERACVTAGALVVAVFGYVRLVQQGRTYADAYEAAFQVGREALYKAMRVSLPATTADEFAAGQDLTKIVYRGTPGKPLTYAVEKK